MQKKIFLGKGNENKQNIVQLYMGWCTVTCC